jgi:tRNA U54 and U55 pseudouridine synthase Pus10
MDKLRSLDGKSVTIGIHGEEGEQKKLIRRIGFNTKAPLGTKKELVNPNLTVSQVASYNEFGTNKTPSRPFIRGTYEKRRQDIIDQTAKFLYRDTENVLSHVGLYVVSLIQEEIRKGIAPENSKYTVERKGSSKPLIDTGQLINSITYKVME